MGVERSPRRVAEHDIASGWNGVRRRPFTRRYRVGIAEPFAIDDDAVIAEFQFVAGPAVRFRQVRPIQDQTTVSYRKGITWNGDDRVYQWRSKGNRTIVHDNV